MNKITGALIVVFALLALGGWAAFFQSSRSLSPASFDVPQKTVANQMPVPAHAIAPTAPSTVTLDLSTPEARAYKTRLTEALKQPANFNEHYVVTEIGCGTGCFGYGVVDKTTGKVYWVPEGNDIGMFGGDIGPAYTLHSNVIKVITSNGSRIDTFQFNGANFVSVSSKPSGY